MNLQKEEEERKRFSFYHLETVGQQRKIKRINLTSHQSYRFSHFLPFSLSLSAGIVIGVLAEVAEKEKK